MLDDFKTALTFLTILPLRVGRAPQPGDLGRAAVWFPVVGLLIGAVNAAGYWLFSRLFPVLPAAALTLTLWVILSGGLHLDGLADCCDGLLSARDPAKRLEIMRDPRHGTFAVLGLGLALLLKLAAVVSLPARFVYPALLLAPVAARAFLFPAGLLPPARSDGLGFEFRPEVNRRSVALACALPVIGLLAAGWQAIAAALAAALAGAWLLWFSSKRIGGLTGDVLGALVELSELTFLLFLTLRSL